MFQYFLIAALVLLQQPERAGLGIVAGTVLGPEEQKITQPVQVVLLSPQYGDLLNSDMQRRLDLYWERYKPAFAQQKEFFFEVSRMAYRDSIQYVVTRMRREIRTTVANVVQESSPDGRFEFKDIPFGEYKIVAVGKIGDRQEIWQDTIEVRTPVPQFLTLKNRVP
jgi:hypothetical protein